MINLYDSGLCTTMQAVWSDCSMAEQPEHGTGHFASWRKGNKRSMPTSLCLQTHASLRQDECYANFHLPSFCQLSEQVVQQ